MPFIVAGAGLLGGVLAGQSAKSAANTQAQAQRSAARIAAEEARFRPVGVTTRFGQSQFQYGPDGRVSGASYTVSPELQAQQDRLMALSNQGLTQAEQAAQQFAPLQAGAQGLFGLGQQYLAQSPEQAAQQYMAKQQDLLAPSRERQFAGLQNQLFQTGRGGLAVGGTGERPSGAAGLGAANPEMEAYYNALAQQDASLAAQAMQAGMDQTRFGAGLMGTAGNLLTQGYQGQVTALSPYQSYLTGAGNIETLGQQPLEMGAALGGRNMNPTGANVLYQGNMAAANTAAAAGGYNPFATALTSAASNPALRQAFQGGLLNAQYGAENVYGGMGRGTVPTQYTSYDYF
jgi:hypothetical protein